MKSFNRISILLVLSLVMLVAGCRKNYVINHKQAVLFQVEYVNYAWGFQHNGFIIDSEGNVLTYHNPENWNFHDSDFRLNEKQVAENISRCTMSAIKIPQNELLKYSSYIKNIASSKVTAMKNVAADAGTTEYLCYQYSESSGIYKGTLIKMEGDFTCENLNFFTKKVAEWMKNINSRLSEN